MVSIDSIDWKKNVDSFDCACDCGEATPCPEQMIANAIYHEHRHTSINHDRHRHVKTRTCAWIYVRRCLADSHLYMDDDSVRACAR